MKTRYKIIVRFSPNEKPLTYSVDEYEITNHLVIFTDSVTKKKKKIGINNLIEIIEVDNE